MCDALPCLAGDMAPRRPKRPDRTLSPIKQPTESQKPQKFTSTWINPKFKNKNIPDKPNGSQSLNNLRSDALNSDDDPHQSNKKLGENVHPEGALTYTFYCTLIFIAVVCLYYIFKLLGDRRVRGNRWLRRGNEDYVRMI